MRNTRGRRIDGRAARPTPTLTTRRRNVAAAGRAAHEDRHSDAHYVNPDTGAQVTYFGMLHLAQEPFFTEVRDRVTQLEADGAHVYLEGITSPESDTLGADTDELRWGIGVVKRKLEAMWREGEQLGLVAQRDALPARDGWQVHDVTVLEAVRVYGVESLRGQHQGTQCEGLLLGHFDPALTRAMTMQSLALVMKAATDAAIRDILFPEEEAKLARVREGKVLAPSTGSWPPNLTRTSWWSGAPDTWSATTRR